MIFVVACIIFLLHSTTAASIQIHDSAYQDAEGVASLKEENEEQLPDKFRTSEFKYSNRALALKKIQGMDIKLWPGGKIYYEIDKSYDDPVLRSKIHTAVEVLTNATCLEFIEKPKDSKKAYVTFYTKLPSGAESCVAEIGFKNKYPQYVVVTPNICYHEPKEFTGVVVHELMHTLGFLHEFQRPDRDAYYSHVPKKGFNKLPGDTKNLTFDFRSITQYEPEFGFEQRIPQAKGYPPPVGELKNMGQCCRLSAGDRTLIDRTYAAECKLPDPMIVHKEGMAIPGSTCRARLEYMDDEMP